MDTQLLFFYISAVILIVTGWLQFVRPDTVKRHASRIFFGSALLTFAHLAYLGVMQYKAFASGVLGLTINTNEGVEWFLGYVRLHFFDQYFVALLAALIVALVAAYFNKRFSERFFEWEELYLAALAILLLGYPAFLFYLAVMLILPVLVSAAFMGRNERLPLYHFWLPVAIAIHLAAHFWLSHMSWWLQFRF